MVHRYRPSALSSKRAHQIALSAVGNSMRCHFCKTAMENKDELFVCDCECVFHLYHYDDW